MIPEILLKNRWSSKILEINFKKQYIFFKYSQSFYISEFFYELDEVLKKLFKNKKIILKKGLFSEKKNIENQGFAPDNP